MKHEKVGIADNGDILIRFDTQETYDWCNWYLSEIYKEKAKAEQEGDWVFVHLLNKDLEDILGMVDRIFANENSRFFRPSK